MVDPRLFFEYLISRNIHFFSGVPDSLLSDLCSYITENAEPKNHVIAANEGNAIGLAIGYYLSTGKLGSVYMQNSGLGNAINPLVSVADPEVYGIPMLLMIGWRGEPNVQDEPQHIKQGKITLSQLDSLEIPYLVMHEDPSWQINVSKLIARAIKEERPVALVFKKNFFSSIKDDPKNLIENDCLSRESALRVLAKLISPDSLVVSTTGKASRELYEIRDLNNQIHTDFLTVGGMGHASSISLGVAIGNPKRPVVCLDGDGAVLMHMGSMPVISKYGPKNLTHVILNNNSHESVGGQETAANQINFALYSESIGYKNYRYADNIETLRTFWIELNKLEGPKMLEIRLSSTSRNNLTRPKETPCQNKENFLKHALRKK